MLLLYSVQYYIVYRDAAAGKDGVHIWVRILPFYIYMHDTTYNEHIRAFNLVTWANHSGAGQPATICQQRRQRQRPTGEPVSELSSYCRHFRHVIEVVRERCQFGLLDTLGSMLPWVKSPPFAPIAKSYPCTKSKDWYNRSKPSLAMFLDIVYFPALTTNFMFQHTSSNEDLFRGIQYGQNFPRISGSGQMAG